MFDSTIVSILGCYLTIIDLLSNTYHAIILGAEDRGVNETSQSLRSSKEAMNMKLSY